MNMKHLITAGLAWLAFAFCAKAQDVHFSQIDMIPLYTNAANTGDFDGIIRGSMHFRDQWGGLGTVFRTFGAAVDARIDSEKRPGNAFGIGVVALQDRAGFIPFNTTRVDINTAYHIKTGQFSSFSAALSTGFFQQDVDLTAGSWDNQWNGSSYNPSRPIGERFDLGSSFGLDLGASFRLKNIKSSRDIVGVEQRGYIIGAGVKHLTAASSSILESNNFRMPRRYSAFAQFYYDFRDSNVGLRPSVFYQRQGRHQEILFGSYLRYRVNSDAQYTGFRSATHIAVGLFHRWRDAVTLAFKGEYANWAACLSYDVTASSMTAVNQARGALEFSLSYCY